MATSVLQIPIGLPAKGECPRCIERFRDSLSGFRGIVSLGIDTEKSTLTLEYDPNLISVERVKERAEEVGIELRERFTHETFDLVGLDCPDCAIKIEKALFSLPGVVWVSVNFASSSMVVEYEPDEVSRAEILARVDSMGYTTRQALMEGERPPKTLRLRTALTILCGALLASGGLLGFLLGQPAAAIILYALAIVAGSVYLVRGAYYSLRTLSLDMNVLMTVAVAGAALIGQWSEGATVVFLFAIGNVLEARAMDGTRASLRSLIDLTPSTALILRGGDERKMATSEIRVGDIMIVRPGERISMDGAVISGSSTVNQAPITGESMSVPKQPGDPIYAGSINEMGTLDVGVTRLAKDNTLARIIELVEEAQAQKAPSQRFIDRFSRYYTPTVIALAAGVAAVPPLVFAAPFAPWFYRALVLLVIACPCALVISTPVSIVSAIGGASRHGVLVKGGAYLEEMAAVRAVAFDKTGTLTGGRPSVSNVVPMPGHSPQQVLSAAAAIERRSEHPVAEAITRQAMEENLRVGEATEFRAVVGQGAVAKVAGREIAVGNLSMFERLEIELGPLSDEVRILQEQGKTVVIVGEEKRPTGLIALVDTPRDESARAISALRASGVGRILMLTGDNARTAYAVSRELGIDEYFAELLPEDKVRTIERLRAEGTGVAMVGDGINDAPALAAASVGIAMGTGGSDTALETADVALISDDLTKLPFIVRLSRRAVSTIKQNVAVSLAIKGLFLVVTVAGLTSLWLAVIADTGTSLLVTANGLRLLRIREKSE